jgi:hypothetical protein
MKQYACVIHYFDEISLAVIVAGATSGRETDTAANNSGACCGRLLFDAE